MTDFYNDFKNDVHAQELFKRLKCKPPSLSYFAQQKPTYVKKANQCEFDLCTYHANLKNNGNVSIIQYNYIASVDPINVIISMTPVILIPIPTIFVCAMVVNIV